MINVHWFLFFLMSNDDWFVPSLSHHSSQHFYENVQKFAFISSLIALNRYYNENLNFVFHYGGVSMTLPKIELNEEVISQMNIPSRPEVLIKVTEAAKETDPDLGKIVDIVGKDVNLSGSLIQVVNSPLYGLRRKISSVKEAGMLLGIQKVERLVTVVSMRSMSQQSVDLSSFWDSAEELANISRLLAKKIGIVNDDDAYMLGLFSNCGIPIMMQFFPEYETFFKEFEDVAGTNFTLEEMKRFRVNHCVVGYKLSEKWFFPDAIRDAIMFHHDVHDLFKSDQENENPVLLLLANLELADKIQHKLKNKCPQGQSEEEWLNDNKAMIRYLGLSEDDFLEHQDEIVEIVQGI